jgi:hypothetical protein
VSTTPKIVEKKKLKEPSTPLIPKIIIDQPELDGIKIPPKTIFISNEALIQVKLCFEKDEDEAPRDAWIGLFTVGASDDAYISQGPVKAKGEKKFFFKHFQEKKLLCHLNYLELLVCTTFVIFQLNFTFLTPFLFQCESVLLLK